MRRFLAAAVILAALVAVGPVPVGDFTSWTVGPGIAAAQDLTARLTAIEGKLAKIDALESRVAALEARQVAPAAPMYVPAPAPAMPDLGAQLAPVLNGALTIQAYKQVFKIMDDRPRGFFASLVGEDSGGLGWFIPLVVTLKAIGTPLGLGF